MELIPIDRAHGPARERRAAQGVILEAFKPGTAPPSTYSIIGYQDMMGAPHRRVAGGRPGDCQGNRRPVLSAVDDT